MILVPIMIFWPTKKIKHTGFLKPKYSVKMFLQIVKNLTGPVWSLPGVCGRSEVPVSCRLILGWREQQVATGGEMMEASVLGLDGRHTPSPRSQSTLQLPPRISEAMLTWPSTPAYSTISAWLFKDTQALKKALPPPASLPPSPLQAQKPPHSRDLQIFQSAIPFHGPQHFVFSEGSNNGLSDVCDVSPWVSDGTVSPIRTPAPKGPLPHPPASWKLIVLDHMQCM